MAGMEQLEIHSRVGFVACLDDELVFRADAFE